jgi:tetratricopeptide (TPR) repeat protein
MDRKYLWAAGIFMLALAVRAAYFFQVKANFPGWDSPTIDPLYHDLWARQIASGDLLGSGPFFRAPLYAYFLGMIYAIAGPSLTAAKIIQHAFGALTCSLIFLFADRYFGRRIAVLSGLLSAFNWVFIYHEDELLLDSLLALLSVTIIWQLLRAADKPSFRAFFIAGLWLGAACITRPNYLAFLPAIFIWLAILQKGVMGKALKYSIYAAAGCLLIILPVTARNIIVGRDAVLIASQGGINFYIGNNQHADGATAALPEFGPTWQYSDAEYLAKVETGRLGREMKQSEVSSFFNRKGLRYIVSEPLDWVGLMIKKLDYFWNGFEISNNQNLYFYRRFAPVTKILPPLFYLISPLSLLGLYLIARRDRSLLIIPLFVITYMLTVIAFFVTSRFRLPVLPFLIILASLGVFYLIETIRKARITKAIAVSVVVMGLAVLTSIDFFEISRESFAMSHFSLGNVYLKKGMQEQALDEYSRAAAMAPCVPKVHLNRGIIFFGRNDYRKAEEEFLLEMEKCGKSPEAHNNLSVLKRLEGDPEDAVEHARTAIEQKPNYLEARTNEILALRVLGRDSLALAAARVLTVNFPEYTPGHFLQGKILSDQGQFAEAEEELIKARGAGPPNPVEKYDLSTIYATNVGYGLRYERLAGQASYELGILEIRRNDIGASLIHFKKAVEILPDFADAWINLALAYDHKRQYGEALEAFQKAISLQPTNPVSYYNLGLTLGKIGRYREAADCFSQALDLKPDFKEAAEKLRLMEPILEPSGQQ